MMHVRACCILSAVYTSERARLSAAVCGCLCDRLSCPPARPAASCLSAASDQQIRRCTVSGSGGGAPSKGGFVSVSSVHALLSASLRLFKSCQPESRKVESRERVVSQSRQSRESRQIKSRKSRKGMDIRVPTCAKVVKS